MNDLDLVDAIAATLTTAGLNVGIHERPFDIPHDPKSPSWEPYCVVELTEGGSYDGTAADPDDFIDGRFTLITVGRLAREALHVADQARVAVTAGFAVTGRSIQRVRPLFDDLEVFHEESVSPPVFYASRLYGFFSFPA